MVCIRSTELNIITPPAAERGRSSTGFAMRIEDFIEATNAAETPEEVFSHFENAMVDFGFDRMLYAALRNHPACSEEIPAVMRNYPDDWMEHYVEAGYIDSDPVREFCVTSRSPFTWDEIAPLVPRKRAKIFDEARTAGIKDGVGIPIHGPNGEAMGIGLASSAGHTDAKDHLSKLFMIGVQFHTAYSALTMPSMKVCESVRLTPREREVLQWCAQGKSNWAVSEILNISEHSVDFHLRNIYRKLGANSRITAVVKALYAGLISL